MVLKVELNENSYDIIVQRNLLQKIGKYINLKRKVLVLTDRGVPSQYADAVCSACDFPVRVTVEAGEESKSFENYESLCSILLKQGFTRTDCICAVGGGVVGDLAGFVAATYMRGIDFYNIPTTLLAQVDASIGGKTAINLDGIKNVVGSFYQPKRVLIDPETLKTLEERQISNGFAEIIKMAITFDEKLFETLENGDITSDKAVDSIIVKALNIKKYVVENDEKENGLRRVLNFGHTIGHGIEYQQDLKGLYHGECVAIGIVPMCAQDMRVRVRNVLTRLGLPVVWQYDIEKIYNAVLHDKKMDGEEISLVFSDKIGTYRVEKVSVKKFYDILKATY